MMKRKYLIIMSLFVLSIVTVFSMKNVEVANASNEGIQSRSLSYIIITKVAAQDQSKVLEGAVFEIRNEKGTYVQEFTTDSEGRIAAAVDPGVFYVTEIKAPQGYFLAENNKNIKVDATEAGPYELTIVNGLNNEIGGNLSENMDEVPETGFSEMFMVVGLGAAIMSGGLYLMNKKRNQ
ncbi:MAG: MSCRAMM family protein [Turicibacter sp.]